MIPLLLSSSKSPFQSSLSLPGLLTLAPILDAASQVGYAVLDPVGHALQAITDSLGAGGVVDGVAEATASCADQSTCCARDAADRSTELGWRAVSVCLVKKTGKEGSSMVQ